MKVGIGTLLFIVFLVLKLGVGDTAVEQWSWWWVTAPLWIPAGFLLIIQGFVLATAVVVGGRK
ncbi:membrane protein [Mycobacterium phage Yecey3]|uniref:Membrane protein n=1 Tax=Mycobacterium phage Yecey3 TaxID=2656617 RepID=A0A649VAM6_9CAUD|nr:membrane protein [Mycobacterium phage Yecey3]QGJ88823.1 membrane protein [Mycobacterium phage Yecey3]